MVYSQTSCILTVYRTLQGHLVGRSSDSLCAALKCIKRHNTAGATFGVLQTGREAKVAALIDLQQKQQAYRAALVL